MCEGAVALLLVRHSAGDNVARTLPGESELGRCVHAGRVFSCAFLHAITLGAHVLDARGVHARSGGLSCVLSSSFTRVWIYETVR